MGKLYVLMLNWNGEHLLKNIQDNLFLNLDNLNIDYEVHVRDNGSTDNSLSILNQWKNTKILSVLHNRDNFSKGVNSLFNQANPADDDIILLLNNDIMFLNKTSLNNMLNLMKSTNAAAVGARLMFEDRETISHVGVIFSKKYGNMCWHLRAGEKVNESDKKNRKFQAVTAACALVKAKNFKSAGLLDESLFWAFEDVSLMLDISINQNGLILCCGNTEIVHLTSHSLKKNPVNKLFLNQNVKYFKNKWFGKYIIDHDFYLNNYNYNVIAD